jgi:predicted RNA polymerase sigma factor
MHLLDRHHGEHTGGTGLVAPKEPALRNYHLLPRVRGDLLVKLGRHAQARAEFERAASLTRNERERALY